MRNSLLAKNVQLSIISLLLLFAVGLVSLFFVYEYYLDQVENRHQTRQAILLEERIDKKQKILHGVAVALSNVSTIRDALAYQDREALIRELGHLRQEYAKWTGFVNYAFHAISYDGRSLYKSYDPDSYGQDVTEHPMIKKVMAEATTVTQVDKGGFGNVYRVITIQPVFALDSNELVGYMTISQGLKQILMEFEADGMEYLVFEQDTGASIVEADQKYVLDNGRYFVDRPLAGWTLSRAEAIQPEMQKKQGWYYQTKPIFDELNNVRAFHLIAVPEKVLRQQALSLTLKLAWILLAIYALVFLMLMIQMGLLRSSVLKPMRDMSRTIKNIIKTKQYNQSVEVLRKDEIGEMSTLFNQLLVRTNNLIFNLKYLNIAIDKTLIVSRADRYGNITSVNDNFCHISGYTAEELIGSPHNLVRHPDMSKDVFEDLWHTIQNKQIWRGEIKNLGKDGTSYYVMSYIIPILDQKDNLVEYLSIRQDITLIVELRETLQRALVSAEYEKSVAQTANKAKSEFLSSMTHELRTPLNAIIGFSQLLNISNLTDGQREQVEIIQSSGKHLLQLINDVLEFAKLESGKLKISLEPVLAKKVVKEAITLTESEAKAHNVTLVYKTLDTDEVVIADRLRLKQVILNLISNAIKYNKPNGEVRLSCQITHKSNQDYWELSVKDTGVGIAKSYLDKVFEPFNRLGHETSNIEGTGIGLSIALDLVNQMQGYLSVTSEEGRGSDFRLGLPLQASNLEKLPSTLEDENFQSKPSNLVHLTEVSKKFRILYIEDNHANMKSMSNIVASLNDLEFKIAPTVENGLEIAKRWPPHLVLLDSNLQGWNNGEALTLFKSIPTLTRYSTQFYAINTQSNPGEIEDLIKLGFDGSITKPFERDDIYKVINDCRKVVRAIE
ncbi:ATP-binding protein [Thiomicrospira pelophila]|uniref:ATP-binding protein n=1 Tax=Thiomicrospira pelophila TaxID=934 RepID=UPI00068B2120|nr:ATP-binding protein [Thiomicrospira pelophila]